MRKNRRPGAATFELLGGRSAGKDRSLMKPMGPAEFILRVADAHRIPERSADGQWQCSTLGQPPPNRLPSSKKCSIKGPHHFSAAASTRAWCMAWARAIFNCRESVFSGFRSPERTYITIRKASIMLLKDVPNYTEPDGMTLGPNRLMARSASHRNPLFHDPSG